MLGTIDAEIELIVEVYSAVCDIESKIETVGISLLPTTTIR
jgi:hypothetical protein